MKRGSNDLSKKRSRGRKISPRAYDLWKQKNKRHANTDTKSVQEKKYICVSCKKIASNRRFSFLICNMYSMYVVIGERCCSFLHQWASCIGLDSVVGNIKKVSANLVKSQRWCVKKANKSTILWQWRPSYYQEYEMHNYSKYFNIKFTTSCVS